MESHSINLVHEKSSCHVWMDCHVIFQTDPTFQFFTGVDA